MLYPLYNKANETKFVYKLVIVGVRAIIVKGGGIRSIMLLLFLIELQVAISLLIDIYKHFDISVNSNSSNIF
jgi:hypothetical protein